VKQNPKDFPESCVRGIPNPDYVYENNTMLELDAFQFQRSHHNKEWLEESINWNDEENVINFTLQTKEKNGDIKYRGGVALIPERKLRKLKARFRTLNLFDYERSPIDGINPYHGNLLIKTGINKTRKRVIRSAIVLACDKIIPHKV